MPIDISRLMRPRSIAIVGISPEPSSAGFLMLKTLEEYAYGKLTAEEAAEQIIDTTNDVLAKFD